MNEIVIRPLHEKDIQILAVEKCPPWSTIEETQERWQKYYKQQQENVRTAAILELGNEIVGYGSLLLQSEYPNFSGMPEIHDVWVYEEFRKKGFATRLIQWLENLAKEKGYTKIGIGVGLYAEYGSAQKLYIRLGYVPDGYGITYKNELAIPGKSYPLDDELILWMKKDLDSTLYNFSEHLPRIRDSF